MDPVNSVDTASTANIQPMAPDEVQASQAVLGRMGIIPPAGQVENPKKKKLPTEVLPGLESALISAGKAKDSDLFEPLYPGAPEGVYKPAAYEDVFKDVIRNSPDPESAEARINGAYLLAQLEGVPFKEALDNFEPMVQSYWNKALSPKDAWSSIQTTYRAATIGTQLADLAYALGQSGGKDEKLLKQIEDLETYMPADDEIKRSLPIEAIKAGAQFIPSQIESLKAGAAGGTQALAIAAPSVAAGVASGAIATEGIGAISLPAILFGVFRAGATAGTSKRTYELETGSCYYDLLRTTQTRKGPNGEDITERVDPETAWKFAQIYGGIAAATEMLPADQFIVGAGKALGLKGAIKETQTIAAAAERTGAVKRIFSDFINSQKSEIGERLTNVASESMQEALQQAAQLLSEDYAKQITNSEYGTKLDPISRQEFQKQVTDTLIQSVAGMTALSAGPAAVSLVRRAGQTSAQAATAAKTLAAEEIDTPFTKMTDEDVAAYHAAATTGEMPEGVHLTRSTIVEGSEYAYNAVDPATKKAIGSVRFEFVPWESKDMPGVVHILGLKNGASPRVNFELMKAVEDRFAGWNIEFEPKNQSQAALKAVMAAENPRGDAMGMNWYTVNKEAPLHNTVEYFKDRIKDVAPDWTDEEREAGGWTIAKWASRFGMSGDQLVDAAFAPGAFVDERPARFNEQGQQIEGRVVTRAMARQGTTGATTWRQVGDAEKALIDFAPGSNPSTALHEVSHAVVNFMRNVRAGAQESEAKQRIVSELSAIESAFGIKDGNWDAEFTGWTGEGTPSNKSNWEAFTYAMEDYLTTGKAPKPELQSVFERFAQWIKDVYNGLKAARVKLNPEITAYFDSFFGDEPNSVTEEDTADPAREGVMPVHEEKPLEIFQGQAEQRAELRNALARAKELEAEGRGSDEIEKETGWRKRQGEWSAPKDRKYTRNQRPAAAPRPVTMNGVEQKPLYQGASFIYKSEEAIDKKPWGKMGGRQILQMLKGYGVKQEEIHWTGLEEMLETDEKLTPAQVKEYIAANKLDIQEVTRAEPKINTKSKYYIPEIRKAIRNTGNTPDEIVITIENDGDVYRALTAKYTELSDDESWAETVVNDVFGTTTKETKYSQYVLPGGENYREVLFTLPGNKENKYHSKHWDEKNVLAHTRLDDRVDTAGRKMLFVEEIQSDWHQEGRDNGYRVSDEEARALEKIVREIENKGKEATEEDRREWAAAKNKIDMQWKMVPDAPFKKTWHEFVFKNILKKAAESLYETIGWTTGAQQAARYDLSKTIETVGYQKRGDNYNISVWGKSGETIYTNQNATKEELDNVIGKELTNKILAGDGRQESKFMYLEGIDLEVGGEGMKSFYDRDVVNYADKLLKPWGVSVQDSVISTGQGSETFHAVEITPELREHILTQGFTLFQGDRGAETSSRTALAEFPDDIRKSIIASNTSVLEAIGAGEQIDRERGSVKLYHGTSKRAANTIERQGILRGYPFLAADQKTAERFAHQAGGTATVVEVNADLASILPTGGYFTANGDRLLRGPDGVWRLAAQKPLYQGEFLGEPINAPKGSVITAINELRTRKAGIVEGVTARDPIGDIAIPWGFAGTPERGYENGFGLAKIIAKHEKRDNVIANLERILKEGAIYQDPENAERLWILHGPYRAVIATYRGYGMDRVYGPWLMTAYQHEMSRGSGAPFIPAGATLVAPETEAQKKDTRKVVIKRRKELFQGNTESPEFKEWFGESKIIDEKGAPMKLYHGTANRFEAFDMDQMTAPLIWTTNRKDKVESGDVGAAGHGAILKLYASIKNPAGWAEYDKYGIDELISQGYDGLMLKDKDQTTVVAFYPEQVKLTDNTGSWNRNDPRLLFQNAEEQVSPNLVAIHNISGEKLLHAAELGGLAMPSLAIVNKDIPMTSFGDITLIAPKDMVDPRLSRTTKLYNSDVYSPRWPNVTNVLDRQKIIEGVDRIYPAIVKAYENSRDPHYSKDVPTKEYVVGTLSEALERYDFPQYHRLSAIAYQYEKTGKADPADYGNFSTDAGEFRKWFKNRIPGAIKEKKLFKGFTNAGNRRYAAYTLENVFAEMKAEGVRGGESFHYGPANIRAQVATQYKTLAQVSKDRDLIVSDEKFDEVKKETDALFDEIMSELIESSKRDDGFFAGDRIVEAIVEGIKRGNVEKELKEWDWNPKQKTLAKISLLLQTYKKMPTEYFEAKLVRTVGLNEFAAAVIPAGTPEDVKTVLAEAGIDTQEYSGGETERATAIGALAQKHDHGTILFQNGAEALRPAMEQAVESVKKPEDVTAAVGSVLTENGAEILEAGQVAGESVIVASQNGKAWEITIPEDDRKAINVAPTIPELYQGDDWNQSEAWHGTAADFNDFSSNFIGSGQGQGLFGYGIYLTGSESLGKYYANSEAFRKMQDVPPTVAGITYRDLPGEARAAIEKTIDFYKEIGIDADTAEIAKAVRESGADDAEKLVTAIEKGDHTLPIVTGKRKLYQVIINKDTAILDWERTMNRQSPTVRACLKKLGINIPDDEELASRAARGEEPQAESYNQGAWMTWADFYQNWLNTNTPQEISEALRDAGIVGMKYHTGSLTGQDMGPDNYVIYDEKQISIKRKILYQGEAEKQRANLLQDAGRPDGTNAEIYRVAQGMAAEGKSWESLMEHIEETKDFLYEGLKVPDLEPEQKRAWYQAIWNAANKLDDKPADLSTWITDLAADGHGKLKAFLATIWTDVMVREQEDAGFGFSEQDAAQWEANRARAADIREQLPEPIIAGAINMGTHGGKMSPKFLASLMGIIRSNPEEYAAMYGSLMHDEKIGALGAAATDRKYSDIKDDERMGDRMSVSERAALAKKIRNEKLEKEILSGRVTDKTVKEYIDRIRTESAEGRKRIGELELELKDAEAQVDENGREIGQNRKKLLEGKAELERTMKRIEKYLGRDAKVPASLESRRSILERETETLRKRLAAAGDWNEIDRNISGAEKRLNGYLKVQAEYRARGEQTPRFIIQAISDAQREIEELKTKQAASKDYRNSAQLQAYLTKIETEAKLKAHLREIEGERKALREIRAYKAKLTRSIMKPTGDGVFYEYQEAIQKIQDGINPENTSARTQEKIDLLREELGQNPSLKSEVSRLWLKRALAKNLNEMTLEELENTERRIRDLRSTGREIQRRSAAERSEMYAYMRSEIGDIIQQHPKYTEPEGYKPEKTELEKLKNRWSLNKYSFQEAHRFIRDLDGGVEGPQYELLIKDRDRYWREEMKNSRRRKEAILEGFKKNGVNPEDWFNTRVTIKDVGPNGTDKVLRKSDLAACEMAFRDENSRQAVLFGDFFTAKEKEFLEDEELMFEGSRRFAILREAIDANLTEGDLKIIDEVFRKDAQENGDRLATIVGAATNKLMAKVNEYFPLRREGVTGEPIYDQIANDLTSRQPGLRKPPKNGFTKTRLTISPKHQKPVKLDLLTTWIDSIDAQEHYINTVLYGQKLDSIYLDPYIQEGIKSAKGDAGLEYILEYITAIKNPNEFAYKNQWEQSIRDLRGNLGVAYLAMRTSSCLKQLITSPWPALPYAGPRLFTEAMKMMINPVGYVKQAEERSVYLKNRTQDQVFEAIKANAHEQGLGKAIKKVDEIGMKGLEIVDRLCVSVGWNAMYEAEMARSGDEKKAIEFADDKTQMTQPSARGVDLPPIYRNAGEATRLLLQFTSSLNVIYQNIRYDIPNAVKNRQWNVALGTIAGYVIAGVLMNAATNRPNPDDDDDTKRKRLMFWALTQGTDSLPLVGQEVTRIMQRAITGEKSYMPGEQTLPGIQSILDGMYRLSGGEIDRAMVQFAQGGGMILGVPVTGMKEIGRAASGDFGALAGWKKETK